ncbi:hypothetical protein [Skermanella pratensis]|uniref:hypothetical protein n=1 Tax=Skermanella pratensis TaxID=2233999 RepID=UPI001788439E|nr:hypothetical protein [Skermanella pratensis]
MGRYSFTVQDFHPLLLAGLPALSASICGLYIKPAPRHRTAWTGDRVASFLSAEFSSVRQRRPDMVRRMLEYYALNFHYEKRSSV